MKGNNDFSKLIVWLVSLFVILVIITSFFMMYNLQDLSSLNEIIIGSFGLMSLCLGFYFWKAKNENLVKIMNQLPQEQKEEVIEELEEEFEENIDQDDFSKLKDML